MGEAREEEYAVAASTGQPVAGGPTCQAPPLALPSLAFKT